MLRAESKALICWLGLLLMSLTAWAEAPQHGTVSADEAAVLWDRAQSEFQKSNFEAAAHALRRLTARVPAHPHLLAATRLLGESELKLGRYAEAKAAFENYLANAPANSLGRGEASNEVRALLAETYLRADMPTQALLIAEQLLKHSKQGKWTHPLDSQIQKARALAALRQFSRAESALAEARKRLASESGDFTEAQTWISSLDFQLRAVKCDDLQLPTSEKWARSAQEEQVLDRIQRHSHCVQTLGAQKPAHPEAAQAWERSQEKLRESCKGPTDAPAAMRGAEGARTREQKTFYLRELGRKIREICETSS